MNHFNKKSVIRRLCALWMILAGPSCLAGEFILMDDFVSDTGLLTEGAPATGLHGLLGVMATLRQREIGTGRASNILPLVMLNYRDTLYWSGLSGGWWLTPALTSGPRLGLAVRLRRGWDAGDDPILTGMADRDNSVEGGVNILWHTKPLHIGFGYFTDLSDRSQGRSVSLRLSRLIALSSRWQIAPRLTLDWLNRDLVDYYYEVAVAEATPNRPAYSGEGTINTRLGFTGTYRMSQQWMLVAGINYTRLGAGITDSPLVSRASVVDVHAGFGARF